MVFNPRERSECACAYFYSDPLFERKKEIIRVVLRSPTREGTTERALCRVVFFESSEEEKGKRRPNNRPSVSKKAASSGKK